MGSPSIQSAPRPAPRPRAPSLAPQMSQAQRRAQDATVAILRRYASEAEAYLAMHPQDQEAGERLCPCGIVERQCACPIRRARPA